MVYKKDPKIQDLKKNEEKKIVIFKYVCYIKISIISALRFFLPILFDKILNQRNQYYQLGNEIFQYYTKN